MQKKRLAIPTLFLLAAGALIVAIFAVSGLIKLAENFPLEIPSFHLTAIALLCSLALLILTIHNRRLFPIAILFFVTIITVILQETDILADLQKGLLVPPALGLLLIVVLLLLTFFTLTDSIVLFIIVFFVGVLFKTTFDISWLSDVVNRLSPIVIPTLLASLFLIILTTISFRILSTYRRWFIALSVLSITIGILLVTIAFESQLIKSAGKTLLLDSTAIILLSIIFIVLVIIFDLIALFLSKYKALFYLRYVLLWSSRLLGNLYCFLNSGWRTQAVRLADVTIIVWLVDRFLDFLTTSNGNVSFEGSISALSSDIFKIAPFPWEKILVIWFLFEILRFTWNSSQRLVIEDSIYNSSDRKGKEDAKSSKEKSEEESRPVGELAALLAVKLNRINELYQAVDEKRAIRSESGAGKPIDATIKTQDISEILKSSASDKSELSLGPIKVPMGSITSLVGRLMQGPRIVVSLHNTIDHNDNKCFYLTANMTGKEQQSWVIGKNESLEVDSDKLNIEDLVNVLAHKIFAKLAFEEPGKVVAWRAVWRFNEGLRSYRDCLHTEKNRQYYLKKSEISFIKTVEEDSDFVQAYYNLGVVYTEQKQFDSAEAAFYKAIEKNPNGWEAYYALGLNIIDKTKTFEELFKACGKELDKTEKKDIYNKYEDVINLCRRVIDLKQEEASFFYRDYSTLAKVYDLMGIAQQRKERIGCMVAGPICCSPKDVIANQESRSKRPCLGKIVLDSAIKSCEKAVNYSWMALFHAEFWGDGTESAKNIVSECIIDLVELYLYKHRQVNRFSRNEIRFFENRLDFYAAKYLEQAIYLKPSDSNLFLWLGKAYCSIEGHNSEDHVYLPGARIAPEDPRFWACISCIRKKDKQETSQASNKDISEANKQKALQSINKYLNLGMDTFCEANEIAIHNVFPEENVKILMRALFLAKLEKELKRCAVIIPCLEKILEGKSSENYSEKEDAEWKYAQVCIALHHLYKDLEWKDRKILEGLNSEETIERAIQNILNKFSKKQIVLSKEKDNSYLIEFPYKYNMQEIIEVSQDLYVLGNLYYIKYDNSNKEHDPCFRSAISIMSNAYAKESQNNSQEYCKRYQYVKEYLRILLAVGNLYLDYNPKDSKEYFKAAIKLLKKEDPEEIKRSGLGSLLARSIRVQDERQNSEFESALKAAHKARLANPLGYEEHKELGRIFCSQEEFDYGLEELNSAYSWKPDDPDILVEIGKYQLKRAQNCYNEKARQKDLEAAARKINQALKIYDRSQIRKRGTTRYWLGKVYLEQGNYAKAIPHFRILHKLLSQKDDIWLVATLQLGHTYLKLKEYDECEILFGQIIDNKNDKNIFDTVGDRLDDRMYLAEVIAWACLGKAFSFAERDGNVSFHARSRKRGLHHPLALSDSGKAKFWIHKAKDYIIQLNQMDFRERKLRCLAACDDCMGWILYKQDDIDDAIEFLHNSISKKAKAISYLHLALAYQRKLEMDDLDKKKRSLYTRQALECCEHAYRLDIKKRFSKKIGDIQKNLGGEKAKEIPEDDGKKASDENISNCELNGT